MHTWCSECLHPCWYGAAMKDKSVYHFRSLQELEPIKWRARITGIVCVSGYDSHSTKSLLAFQWICHGCHTAMHSLCQNCQGFHNVTQDLGPREQHTFMGSSFWGLFPPLQLDSGCWIWHDFLLICGVNLKCLSFTLWNWETGWNRRLTWTSPASNPLHPLARSSV
jgi:hypothetical protein